MAEIVASPLTPQVLNSSPTLVAFPLNLINSIQQVFIEVCQAVLGAGSVMMNTAQFLLLMASQCCQG